jgi:hypothetical protein
LNGLDDLLHPGDLAVAESARPALREGPIEMIVRVLKKSGLYVWISARLMQKQRLIRARMKPTREPIERAIWAPAPEFI